MLKYLVFGGHVISQSDDDIHYISARKLVELYRVPINECVLIDESNPRSAKKSLLLTLGLKKNFIVLRPKFDGNYTLPIKGN